MSQTPRESLPTEALLAIQAGRRIEAVKILREQRGLDLREAKALVDAAAAQADARAPQKINAREDSGMLRLVAALVVIGGVAAALLLL